MVYWDNFLSIHMYIFQGEELIFSRETYYATDVESVEACDMEVPPSVIDQNHRKTLMRLVLKSYAEEVRGEYKKCGCLI